MKTVNTTGQFGRACFDIDKEISMKSTPNKGKGMVRVRTSKESGLMGLLLRKKCKELGLTLLTEYKFLENRKFRFDFYIPEIKTGVEYEGTMSKKSRHTTITGYSGDCEKYNLAVINGHKVLRYTALNYSACDTDLETIYKINH